jgi:uncharacterized protein (DUF1778 family)
MARRATQTKDRGRSQRLEARISKAQKDLFLRAAGATEKVGSVAVVVDAKNAAAEAFYRRYSFVSLADQPHRLFLPMAVIAKLFR